MDKNKVIINRQDLQKMLNDNLKADKFGIYFLEYNKSFYLVPIIMEEDAPVKVIYK